MPYLAITTNKSVSPETRMELLKEGTSAISAGTGKPEAYVMVKVEGDVDMMFAGMDAPAAMLEVKSIGYPDGATKALTRSLSELVTRRLGIGSERIYVVFTDVKAAMWGFNGKTFG